MIISSQELVNKAIAVYNDRKNWTYVQGALGQLGESDRVRGLYNYFWNMPNHGGNSMTMPYEPWLAEYGKGKHCTDCSNFLNYLLGYTFSMYSTKGYATMAPFEGEIKDAPPGTALCLFNDKGVCGHVGLSIGNDEFLDFYKYNETCRKGKISESLFSKAVYIKDVAYNIKPKAKTLKAVLRDKVRYVGDYLTKDDFVVTVTNPDGTIQVVTDFMFTPTRITNVLCVVAIVYGNLEPTYLAINAESKGTFYCVNIPADSAEDALLIQQTLSALGFHDTAIVNM